MIPWTMAFGLILINAFAGYCFGFNVGYKKGRKHERNLWIDGRIQ